MKDFKFATVLAICIAPLFTCIVDANAQNEALIVPERPIEQVPISPNELIKLATKAPMPEQFANEEEYNAAKQAWKEENPAAYARIVGKEGNSSPE